jgi:LAO/AO transport system ATPase
MLDDLLERFRRKDRLALSKLLSLIARGEQVEAILGKLADHPPHPTRIVAITGSGGVGKSSLTGRLIGEIRNRGSSVAVLACDPQSPLSGGALLGDRFRMPARADDEGVYIRSLAAAGGRGALAEHLPSLFALLEAFGFDNILLETVGAGQGDTAVHHLVDVVVLLLQPETGDDLQWEKAGLLEVADVIVIHKADLPHAEKVEAEVLGMLHLSPGPSPPVLRVSAKTGEGISSLWQAILDRPLRRGQRRDDHDLLEAAQHLLGTRFHSLSQTDPGIKELLASWRQQSLSTEEAAQRLLALLTH